MRRHDRFGKINRPNFSENLLSSVVFAKKGRNDINIRPTENNKKSQKERNYFLLQYNKGNRDFQNTCLRNIDLSKLYIENINFSNCDLSDSNFSSSRLNNVSFNNAILNNTNFKNIHLDNVTLDNVHIEYALFNNARLNNVSFKEARLYHTDLTNTQFINPYSLTLEQLVKANYHERARYDSKFIESIEAAYIVTSLCETQSFLKGTYDKCLKYCQEYAINWFWEIKNICEEDSETIIYLVGGRGFKIKALAPLCKIE